MDADHQSPTALASVSQSSAENGPDTTKVPSKRRQFLAWARALLEPFFNTVMEPFREYQEGRRKQAYKGQLFKAVSARLRRQAEDRKITTEVLEERGIAVDWRSERYRHTYRSALRAEVSKFRLEVIGACAFFAAFMALNVYVAIYFVGSDGVAISVFVGLLGLAVVWIPMFVIGLLRRRFPRLFSLLFLIYAFGSFVAGLLIVYGEIQGTGPVHALIGRVRPDGVFAYMLVCGVINLAVVTTVSTFVLPIESWVYRHQRLTIDPSGTAIRLLMRCVVLARSSETFMHMKTRRALIRLLHDVAIVLKFGLWRQVRPQTLIARSLLKQRCVDAGMYVEMLTVWVTLPAKTTHGDLLDELCRLIDALVSGRLDELPTYRLVNPVKSKIRIVVDFARAILVGAVPLVVLLVIFGFLDRFKVEVQPVTQSGFIIAAAAWLLTRTLHALGGVNSDHMTTWQGISSLFSREKSDGVKSSDR